MSTTSASAFCGLALIGWVSVACSKPKPPPSSTVPTEPAATAAPSSSVVETTASDAAVPGVATWCWRALPAPFAHEDAAVMVMGFSLASTGKTAWLGYSGSGTFLSTYEAGSWTPAPISTAPSALYAYPSLVSNHSGVWVAWTESGGDQSKLHVARRSGNTWVPVGGEVGVYPDAFTNAGDQALAIDAAGTPTLVWTESKPGSGGGGPRSLQAARWDGTAWRALGALDTNVDRAAPSVAVDASGTPWVAWIRDRLHVARLSGTAWIEAPVPARARGDAPHLVIEPGGTAFVSWSTTAISVARTNGSDWNEVSGPSSHGVRASSLQLVDGTPVIAWSEGDRGEIASAAVARFVGGHWVDVFRGMQADTGQSDVFAIALAPSDKGIYLAWDEPGEDGARTRVIEAWPCAVGETPVAIPASKPRASFWPKTVDDAVTQILSNMDEASKKLVRETPRGELYKFHLGWGTGIRNDMGLWRGNAALLASCHTTSAESCSSTIIEKTWERLQTEAPVRDR